jgi:hypothetical protein
MFTTYLAYREGSRWAGGQSNSSSWQPAGLQRGYRSHGDIKQDDEIQNSKNERELQGRGGACNLHGLAGTGERAGVQGGGSPRQSAGLETPASTTQDHRVFSK